MRCSCPVSTRLSGVLCRVLAPAILIAAPLAASEWQAVAGAQSTDLGKQALAFLPNELWVHTGDSIIWTFPTNEIHTVTFLKPGQVRPPFPVGCPGTTPDGSSFNGAACVNSGLLSGGATYTVNFPAAGNFKFVCLVHSTMNGVVHVLDLSQTLPLDQNAYNREAEDQATELLSEASELEGRGLAVAQRTPGNEVTAGIGKIAATGGGWQGTSVVRFLRSNMTVSVGDTVEWTNDDPGTPHTVTFGAEPSNPAPPSTGVTVDPDGARHAVISSANDNINSGLIAAAPQDRVGLPQVPPGITRFRVTFTAPGTFNYICALHDDLGMTGSVRVLP